MNVVYYRMVNGYGYVPYTGNTSLTTGVTGQPHAALGSSFSGLPGSGQGLGMLPGPQALMPTPATSPLAASALATNPLANGASSLMPKWMLPNFSATQIQYMFRPRMTKTKTTKPVRCETCNITLNSEQQAKQHFNGKSHLKKLRQQSAPADEKKKLASGDESTEKKKSDEGDEEKTDDDENDKSSSTKPCSVAADDDVASVLVTAESTASSLTVAKYSSTAAPSAGEAETSTSESSEGAEPKNQSGKDSCVVAGTDTTTTTNIDCEASSAVQASTDINTSESDEAASRLYESDGKEQSNSSPLPDQPTTATTCSTELADSQNSNQSSSQENSGTKTDTGSQEKHRQENAFSSSGDANKQVSVWKGHWERSSKSNRHTSGWGKVNTRSYHSNGANRDVDVVHSKTSPSSGFLMQSMMQFHQQYQTYGGAGRLADRSSLLGIDGGTPDIASPLTGLPSPCLPLSPPVAPYAPQQFAPAPTALMPYTPTANLINPTSASGLLTPSLLSASTGSPAVYPTTAGALPNAHGMAMLGYSNGLYAGNAIGGLNMYYKNSHTPNMAANSTRLLSNGFGAFYGNDLTYGNGAAVDDVCNGQQGATEVNEMTMYYHANKAGAAPGGGSQHSMLYQNSVSIPGGSTEYATSGQRSVSNDDPVSKAVMDNIMGRLSRKRKTTEITCTVCDITFNSDAQATEHFRGTRHIKRAKSAEKDETQHAGQMHQTAVKRRGAEQSSPCKGPGWQEVAGYKAGWLHCKTCDISVPSSSQLQRHVVSDRHRGKQESQIDAWPGHQWAPSAL